MPDEPQTNDSVRRPLISGNWKMHHNHFEAIQFIQKFSYLIGKDELEDVDVSIHPPFTDIRSVQTVLEADKLGYFLGAQNCHNEDKGAFTGEISPAFLSKLGVHFVICGHSERREIFGESDDFVNQKVKAVFKHEMVPILCVGETLEEREAGATNDKVLGQVRAGLAGLNKAQIGEMVIAYEPIWAIGTGRTATSDDAQTVCAAIRSCVAEIAGDSAAAAVRIQYGGSVKPGNIAELIAMDDIDGALVGGAALDPDDFAQIVKLGR